MSFEFYLAVPEPVFLERAGVPLLIHRERIRRSHKNRFPRALAPWVLDSRAFTEVSTHGRWLTAPEQYVDETRRYAREIGQLRWAAIQDWMCEPWVIAKTGLSIEEHQRRTVDSYEQLRDLAPEQWWLPVLQGWNLADYLYCVDAYDRRGINLLAEPVVGLGSVCRRQDTKEAEEIIAKLSSLGLRLHGFGFKMGGLVRSAHLLASADSMAWSTNARHEPPMDGCTHLHCVSCLKWALRWRQRLLAKIDSRLSQAY